MNSKKIIILKHIPREGAGTIERFFRNNAWDIRQIELSAGDKLPDSVEGYRAIILMGGPMNVYEEDRYPFLKSEDTFLKKALREQIPVLGICLGAQLLAKAAGARIMKSPEKEIGWYKVSLTKEGLKDDFFQSLPAVLNIFQWHEDTFQVPKNGNLLAESDLCKNQAFKVGKNAYGLQFHIEVTTQMIEEWVKIEPMAGHDKILKETYDKKAAFEKQARIIYHNFAKIIEEE